MDIIDKYLELKKLELELKKSDISDESYDNLQEKRTSLFISYSFARNNFIAMVTGFIVFLFSVFLIEKINITELLLLEPALFLAHEEMTFLLVFISVCFVFFVMYLFDNYNYKKHNILVREEHRDFQGYIGLILTLSSCISLMHIVLVIVYLLLITSFVLFVFSFKKLHSFEIKNQAIFKNKNLRINKIKKEIDSVFLKIINDNECLSYLMDISEDNTLLVELRNDILQEKMKKCDPNNLLKYHIGVENNKTLKNY